MQKVFDTIQRVAESGVDVLIVGETGTGKELVARSIHRRSRRANKPFVPVDCGAIPESLLESEFFGHERGAFTGADNRSIGLLEFADGGTFFLDELGELPPMLQAKLLRTLQERKIRRVGGRTEIDVDVRVVAATARDLEKMIQQQVFRQDLYYRINVVRIDLPPLRERGDDLGLLAEYFATRYSREMGRTLAGITPEAYQVMSQYAWPGNVRQLQNVIRRAIAFDKELDDRAGRSARRPHCQRRPEPRFRAGGLFRTPRHPSCKVRAAVSDRTLRAARWGREARGRRGPAASRHPLSPDEESRSRRGAVPVTRGRMGKLVTEL